MDDTMIGKELVLTASPDVAVIKRSKPTLIQIGNRMVTSDGRFHPDLAADYLQGQARTRWVPIPELAKIFCGGTTVDDKRRMRKSMFRVFATLLNRGEFLVYETLSSGRINAVKLLDVKSELERQAARPQLERMKQRRQVTTEKYEMALQVLEFRERL